MGRASIVFRLYVDNIFNRIPVDFDYASTSRYLEAGQLAQMVFGVQGQLSDFWAEIERPLYSSASTRIMAEIRERQLTGFQIHETGMPRSGCW
jgi:hypothetical protein